MPLSKKYFIAIANILKRHPEVMDNAEFVSDLTKLFLKDNPRFDIDRFYEYIKSTKVYKDQFSQMECVKIE